MGKLTKEEAIKKHRAMWSYIAAQTAATGTKVTKYEAINDLGFTDPLQSSCYLCTYDDQQKGGSCTNCPLCDRDVSSPFDAGCLNGLYDNFERSCADRASEIAFKIATLPEVDKKPNGEIIYEELANMRMREIDRCTGQGRLFVEGRYKWELGRNVISELENYAGCDYKLNAPTLDETLFNIQIETSKNDPDAKLLYRKCD